MIEEDLKLIKECLWKLEQQMDEIYEQVVPYKKDNSKHLVEVKELNNKGKKPRKQLKKATEKLLKDKMGKWDFMVL